MTENDLPCAPMLSALQNANSILLCTHIAPDGDAVGPTLALGIALRRLGKKVTMACADPVPERYAFLPSVEDFVAPEQLTERRFDVAVAIDSADPERMGSCAPAYLACALQLQMDHHPTNPHYAHINWVDGEASAAGCVVYRALKALGIALDKPLAQCLYCAISTDTGNFCFRNTTAEAFAIAADLMNAGLNLNKMARSLHLLRDECHVRLLGRALKSLERFGGGRCAYMVLTAEDYREAGAEPEHSEGIVNYAMNMPGVEMAFLADSGNDQIIKCSLRAQLPRDVARIAAQFGGGGHVLASGFRCNGKTLEQVCQDVKAAMCAQLEEAE